MPPGITFNILGDASGLKRTLGSVRSEIQKTGDDAGSSFKRAGGVIAGALAGAGIGSFLATSIEGWQDHERVVRQSAAVIKSTGGVANVTAAQIGNLSDAIEAKTGVDGDAIQTGANLLATFTNIRNEAGKGNNIFDQTTQIMTDLSVAMNESTSAAAVQLGKALNDPIHGVTALTKVGVTFTQQQRDQIKAMQDAGNMAGAQKIILAELTREFGGSAAAQETSQQRLMVSVHALEDSVGSILTPALNGLATVLTNDVVPAVTATTTWLQNNWSWLKYVTGALVIGVGAWKAYTIAVAAGGAWRAAQAGLAGVELALSGVAGKANTAGLKMAAFRSAGGLAMTGFAAGIAAVGAAGFAIDRAINGTVTVFDKVNTAVSNATTAQQSWRDALQQSNGVLTESLRLSIAKQLQDQGLAAAAAKVGFSLKDVVAALTGSDSDWETFRSKLFGSKKLTVDQSVAFQQLRLAWTGGVADAKALGTVIGNNTTKQQQNGAAILQTLGGMTAQGAAAARLAGAIGNLSGKSIDAAQAQLQFRDALGQEVQAQQDAQVAVQDAQDSLAQAVQAEADAETSAARQVADAEHAVAQARQDAAQQARQAAQATADAEQKLAQSQKDARTAQQALTQARRDAAQALHDMTNQVADADLAQRSAKLALDQAAVELGKTMADPNATQLDRDQAQLSYDQAKQSLQEQTEATRNQHAAADQANKAGVEGSQQVKDAKAGVVAATQAEQQAERDLAAARRAQTQAAVDGAQKIADAQQALADAQHSAAESMASASRSVAQAQRALTTAIAASSTSLSTNTAKGRANREWMLSQLKTIGELAQAQLDAGDSTDAVSRRMHNNEAALRAAAIAAGFNAAEVDAMIRTFGRMPKVKTTTVNVVYNVIEHVNSDGSVSLTNGNGKSGVGGFRTNAQGTGYFRGRESLVGENGPEIVRLPYGSQVDPSSVTASKLGSGGDTYNVNITLPNAVMTQAEADRMMTAAVERALNSGARMNVRPGSIRVG